MSSTHSRVRFRPAFHPETELFIGLGPDEDFLRITTHGHEEVAPISLERGVAFLDELAAVDPLAIPNGHQGGIDGIQVDCHLQQANGDWAFSAWSPSPRHHPRQHAFITAVCRLAADVARQPASTHLLRTLLRYLEG